MGRPAGPGFSDGPHQIPLSQASETRDDGSFRWFLNAGAGRFEADYYLHTGTESSPWVIGLLRLKAPTGDEDRGVGTGAADVEAGVAMSFGPVEPAAPEG